ncbi:MAG: phosphoribosylaminoimidazolesuccinocarboxamide synthase [Bacilli bacterium]|nr:phosphoribosylaminoimidazolesuccinocarboxamide synthase [Bacilli bacterium]
MKNEIVIFNNQEVKLEVNMKDETVWLSLEQMAKLFGRDKSVISRHIKKALEEELINEEVVAKFATTTKHGSIEGKTQTHLVDYYNLDMIISVGYRVKSKNGIAFRKWANKIIKDYMIKGYAVNQKRLEYLEKTVKLIDIATRVEDELKDSDAKDVLKVINEYSKALNLLDDYDHKTVKKIKGRNSTEQINYDECMTIISMLKFNEQSDLFALERNEGLKSIIGAIYQTYDNKDVYPSIEEKAANFLYLTIKNHTFIDGNKRIAATLFIYFLQFYHILHLNGKQIIDNNTLTALTLLIAQSNPKEKNILIELIMNFLNS